MALASATLAAMLLIGGDDASTVTMSVSGDPNASLSYRCRLSGGAVERGDIEPPYEERWLTQGVRCRFYQESGHSSLTIRLHSGGNRQTVRTGGPDSTVILTFGAIGGVD